MTRPIAVALAGLALVVSVAAQETRQMPVFQVDPTFFKPLPNDWVTGQGSAVAVDKSDHVWVFHRPRYVPSGKKAAPPVLEFDANGGFVQGWGGPAAGYEWFDQEHGIYVDDRDNVWLTGSARPALAGPAGREEDRRSSIKNKSGGDPCKAKPRSIRFCVRPARPRTFRAWSRWRRPETR
jgi:hypothetical protein